MQSSSLLNQQEKHQQALPSPLQSPPPKHQGHQRLPASAANPGNTKWLPHEERLKRTWRKIGTLIVNCMSKAEAASAASQAQPPNVALKDAKKRELDETVLLFLRTRREFHRLLSHTEAKLQGKAEEMESLETYVRTQPRVGNRKRKRGSTAISQL